LLTLKENEVKKTKNSFKYYRVRYVAQGPDGYIHLGVEGKGIVKIMFQLSYVFFKIISV
jgi:hypothetical protein